MNANYPALTNTEFERLALLNKLNFSDGHARLPLSPFQLQVLRDANQIIRKIEHQTQHVVEADFVRAFFQCAQQRVDKETVQYLSYSSSCAIKITAQLCRIKKLQVLLIEPCFDNIRHMLFTENVDVEGIPEEKLHDLTYLDQHIHSNTALWVVQPNNPTGFCLEKQDMQLLFDLIKRKNSLIIIDFCFRFFSPTLTSWDQYAYLKDAGASFIGLEDTGKTWSFLDNKVGITVSSPNHQQIIHRLHDELLLNVSPFQLAVLTEFIDETIAYGIENSIVPIITRNREQTLQLVQKKLLCSASPYCHNVPMELLQLPENIPAIAFWNALRKRGIDILPATNYYWTNPSLGSNLFRIPLARPSQHFQLAIPVIEATLQQFVHYD